MADAALKELSEIAEAIRESTSESTAADDGIAPVAELPQPEPDRNGAPVPAPQRSA